MPIGCRNVGYTKFTKRRQDANASSFTYDGLVRCQLKDACLGGVESPCSEEYHGLRCGECSEERYLWGGSCSPCGAYSVVIVLFVILIVIAVIVLLFFLWQVLLNPLVGSPFIFAMRLAETLAILGQSSLKWPSQVMSGLCYTGPRLYVPQPFPDMHLLLLPISGQRFVFRPCDRELQHRYVPTSMLAWKFAADSKSAVHSSVAICRFSLWTCYPATHH